jgi:DnaK suppressor protein
VAIDIDAIRRTLTEDVAKLRDVLADLGATEDGEIEDSSGFQHGFSDAAADTASRLEILQLAGRTADELQAVRAAIGRIDDGRFGICEECGGPVGDERLEFRPTSARCIECQRGAA